MERYIDADKVMEEVNRIGGHNLCEWKTIGVKALIDRQPTADVVPKSEVEELIRKNESLAKTVNEASELIRKLRSKVKKSKTEVAREIFEEIENRLLPSNTSGEFRGDSVEWFDYFDLHLAEDIAELKKKYED